MKPDLTTVDRWGLRAELDVSFWARVDRSGGPNACWPWIGGRNIRGYGQVNREGRQNGAHRWAYRLAVGPIPAGLQIDHLCRHTSCVNPAHLEAVTGIENNRRFWTTRTHCKRGHEFTPENTYMKPRGRSCRACQRMHSDAYLARKRAA